MEETTTLFTLRMPTDIKDALTKRAKSERRDMTGHVLYLLEKDLRENGYLPELIVVLSQSSEQE